MSLQNIQDPSSGQALMEDVMAAVPAEYAPALVAAFLRNPGAVYISAKSVRMADRRRAIDQLVLAGLSNPEMIRHLASHYALTCRRTAYREIAAAKERLSIKASS